MEVKGQNAVSGGPSFDVLIAEKQHCGRPTEQFEATLRVTNSTDAQEPDEEVECQHQHRPEQWTLVNRQDNILSVKKLQY